MGRIAEAFSRVRDSKRPGLVAYVTAGDPDLARTAEILVVAGAATAPTSWRSASRSPIRWPTVR